MILLLPHASDGVTESGLESVRSFQSQWAVVASGLPVMFPCLGASGKLDIFLQHFLMHTVSFIIYITVWLTLLCVLFDFYWIYIKICGESVPLRPDKTEKIYKEPGGPYQIGKVLRALFSPRKVYSSGLHRITIQHGKVVNLWLDSERLCEIRTRTAKVNQNWFTLGW